MEVRVGAGDHEVRRGRGVFHERLLAKEVFPEFPADQLSDERLFHRALARRHFKRTRDMLERLGWAHLPPLARRVRPKRVEPAHELLVSLWIKKRFHDSPVSRGRLTQNLRRARLIATFAGPAVASEHVHPGGILRRELAYLVQRLDVFIRERY